MAGMARTRGPFGRLHSAALPLPVIPSKWVQCQHGRRSALWGLKCDTADGVNPRGESAQGALETRFPALF